jgi:hypothetical protein
MVGSGRVASKTTGPAALSLSTVPHTAVGGAAVVTCGLPGAQPVTPAATADTVAAAAGAVILTSGGSFCHFDVATGDGGSATPSLGLFVLD